ncbi:MAG: sensor histidine kinase [Chloroflexia bacterium]
MLIETLLNGAADDPDARDAFLTQLHEQVAPSASSSNTRSTSQLLRRVEARVTQRFLFLLRARRDKRPPHAPVGGTVAPRYCARDRARAAARGRRTEQFRTVFTNLLHNAVKWSPTGGTITVRVRRDAGDVRFEVQDYGQGVSAEALPRLFERFYKGDEARTGSGTGLGLAIAKHIVELYGGRIWAVSEHGQGACFVFTLPAASASST